MKVSLTADEATTVRVAIKMAESAHTHLVSMSPSKEVRQMLMDALRHLHAADRKIEAAAR